MQYIDLIIQLSFAMVYVYTQVSVNDSLACREYIDID